MSTLRRGVACTAVAGMAGLAACSNGAHQPTPAATDPRPPTRAATPALQTTAPLPRGAAVRTDQPPLAAALGQQPRAVSSTSGAPVDTACRYVAAVWTYTPATYGRAAVAPGLTTAALAARSRPSRAVLEQIHTAGQTSAVRVSTAGLDPEARSGPSTAYVSVVFTATVTYRGSGSGRPVRHVWELRLTQAGRRWLVDAVLGAD